MSYPFVHLHVHTEYSLLDGSAKISELVTTAKAQGMNSLAITDHGVMYGVIDFYKAATKAGIKPILGCEVYVAPGSRHDKKQTSDGVYQHLVLLAENLEGYHNLVKLVSLGFTEGFYYRPRVDVELLQQYNSGLIALSGCLSGVVPRILQNSTYEAARDRALLFESIFGKGNFYLELQNYGSEEQQAINLQLVRMSKETDIPLVATNDVHYINQSDAKAHEVLLCIQTGKTILDEDRMSFDSDQFYLKPPEEMYALFPFAKDAVENTQKIADRCNVEIAFNEYKLPVFEVPDKQDAYQYLKQICEIGLTKRYGEDAHKHLARLHYELDTINSMGFNEYFLIVWDFIEYARKNGIMVGPGRGSGAGSIVAYALWITDIDPIPYSLLFERFLNPERISMPDFDIDFCYERRQEVIDYVNKKYGSDHVAQIITFGTMAARAVTRDVGRALGMPYADVDRVAKMIPTELGITINKALDKNPELKDAYEGEDDTQNLMDMALRLEGLPRHASTHAAGVVICDKPVQEYIPLNLNDGVVTTQFSMKTVEELGLLKMDFLGLRTLTVIRIAAEEVKRGRGIEIDLNNWTYNDPKVYELISQAKTDGVFQLESSGMKNFMRDLSPGNMEDIIAGISLFRPGPMDSIPKYVRGKRNPSKISYMHPSLEPILKDTYGCIVYQEQVMQIVRDLAGYSMGRSDLIRRAMSKKEADVMAQERKNFIYGLPEDGVPGCIANGVPEAAANQIFDDMTDFAAYAFNKSHAAGYAVVSYQTAWLKCYYPVEFMSATMTSYMDSIGKVAAYIYECKKMGIKLLPPDINEGHVTFSVAGNDIRFALAAIRNVGRGMVNAMVKERERGGKFRGITDFIRRMSPYDINKRCVESLIKAGAFDSLGGTRAQYMTVFENIMSGQQLTKKTTLQGQMSLFDLDESTDDSYEPDDLPNIGELPKRMLLANEKDMLGVYVSGHPLSDYEDVLRRYTNYTSLDFNVGEAGEEGGYAGEEQAEYTSDAENNIDKTAEDAPSGLTDGQSVKYGGMITAKSVKYTKAENKPFCFLTVEDMYGAVEVVVFNKLYEKFGPKLNSEQVVIVQGKVSVREDEDSKIIANDMLLYDDIPQDTAAKTLWVKVPKSRPIPPNHITDILSAYRGDTQVMIFNEAQNRKFLANKSYWVSISDDLVKALEALLGSGSVKITEK
ncbi:MAG: DNA polymerase III subunit alpha [Defluviitaleaceae bacterium]|nr:DNA polymerase III subunit alpha [Defluviitaleaceae bacterium]